MRAFQIYTSLRAFGGIAFLVLILSPGTVASGQSLDEIDPGFEIMEWNGGEVVRDEALVQFKQGHSSADRAALHDRLDCELIEKVADGLDRISLNGKSLEKALAAYNRESIVDYAEPHVLYRTLYTPNDSSWSQQWGPQNMKCPEAWDIHKGGADSIVAILDSSVDYTHEDLAAHYHYGHDYFNGDSDPYDFFDIIGHGTHCTGIAAAVTDNGKGIAGVGFNCKFAFYQVGFVLVISDSAVIQSINDTISRGWQVISMSFGGTASSQSMQNALDNAYNAGVVCVAAAGNEGTTQILYPAGYSSVLAVASHNQNNQRSSFSTYGNWVDVSAPGEGIYSTIYSLWGSYTNMDGTSMACPHVAGMANILYSLIGGQRNKANADLILAAIRDSAVPASWVQYGRVDLEGAMNELTAPPVPSITSVSPSAVQAFMGGTITVEGLNFTGAIQVNSGSTVLTPPDFTIVNDNTITYSAPTAGALGSTAVSVTNAAGTSNFGYFDYVETDPPKLDAAATTGALELFTWSYGGGANDYGMLVIATNSSTAPYHGFDILVFFTILYSEYLDSEGLGSLSLTIPTGLQGLIFHSQIFAFEPGFAGASNIESTEILN